MPVLSWPGGPRLTPTTPFQERSASMKHLSARLGLLGLATGAACLLAGSASASGGLHVIGVPSANPRFGVANNVLTPSAHEVAVAWGSMPLANPDVANGLTHYGYDTSNGGPLTQDAQRGQQDRAGQERLPGLRRQALPLPGSRERRPGLGHPDQPRRDRPGQAGHADQRHRRRRQRRSRPSTASPGTRSPTSCCSPRRALLADRRRARGHPGRQRRPGRRQGAAPRRARLRRLRGRAERRATATSGWSRTSAAAPSTAARCRTATSTGSCPQDKTDLTAGGTLQALQIMRARRHAGHRGPAAGEPVPTPFLTDLHTYGTSFATTWVDVHTGPGAFDATAAAKAAGATPLKRPENGVFRPGTRLPASSTSPRPGTPR